MASDSSLLGSSRKDGDGEVLPTAAVDSPALLVTASSSRPPPPPACLALPAYLQPTGRPAQTQTSATGPSLNRSGSCTARWRATRGAAHVSQHSGRRAGWLWDDAALAPAVIRLSAALECLSCLQPIPRLPLTPPSPAFPPTLQPWRRTPLSTCAGRSSFSCAAASAA